MKRLNTETNKPFKRGDMRADGYVFRQYDLKNISDDGFFYEIWTRPTNLANNRDQINELSKARFKRIRYGS